MDISLRSILHKGKATAPDYMRWLQTVLAGISRHTIEGRENDLAAFRESLLKLSATVEKQTETAAIEKTVTVAMDHFKSYNERTAKLNAIHLSELKSIMRAMTDTITFLSESRTRSVHQLQFVERELEQAVELEDIRQLRSKLVDCIDIVREETVRLHQRPALRSEAMAALIAHPLRADEPTNWFGCMDSVTGLPSRRVAEQALTDASSHPGENAVALFVLNRMPGINARYGRAIGDDVMLRVANHFSQHLSSATSLYRWSGPALVALAEVRGDYEDLKRAWTQAAAIKQQLSLSAEQRSVFVIMETTINFYRLDGDMPARDLFRTLDQAVAGYSDPVPVNQ